MLCAKKLKEELIKIIRTKSDYSGSIHESKIIREEFMFLLGF